MTNREFWQLKKDDLIRDTMRDRDMRIIKREVLDEVVGMIISKYHTQDIKNGRKYVQLTCVDQKGNTWYYDSTRKDNIDHLHKLSLLDLLQNGLR